MLQNIKVVELANILAGPAAGMFFAELGAEVVKIENKLTGGDLTRKWKLASENSPASAYYHSVNWGKKSIFLDLNDEKDKAVAYREIAAADIVITNFKAGDEVKLGMDYDRLKTLKEDIIYARIKGFPGDERPAFDVVLQAETGFMHMNGTPESGPLKMPVALIDVLAAHQLKEAILLALLQKEKTGTGAFIEVSLYEAAIASLANQAANWLNAGHLPQPSGSLHPNIAPYGETFVTRNNRKIVLAIGSDKQFAALCEILNEPGLINDERFLTNQQRVRHRQELRLKLQELISNFPDGELEMKFREKNIPAGLIKNMEEVFKDKPAQEMILKQKEEDGSISKRVKTAAFRIK